MAVWQNSGFEVNCKFNKNKYSDSSQYDFPSDVDLIAAEESKVKYKSKEHLKKDINKLRKAMDLAVKELDFMEAAKIRDIMIEIQKKIN
jgi:excinuclease ABC subunit B